MIDNEETQILGGGHQNSQQAQAAPVNNAQQNSPAQPQKKDSGMTKGAYAAGGFVAGVASTAAVNAMAGAKTEEVAEQVPVTAVEEEPQPVAEVKPTAESKEEPIKVDPADSPSEQDVIIATDEGIRVAQVDDDKSFAEAFADARAQVGPGGVFEWHGKVYGTYYKNEWDQMSSEERAEWQAKVDYEDVRDENEAQYYAQRQEPQQETHHEPHHAAAHAEAQVHQTEQPLAVSQEPATPSDQQMVDDTPADGEIKVIGVEHTTVNGNEMNVALLEHSSGDQALLVDIDNDGQFDVLLHDDNGDGQLTQDEAYDASEMGASVADLQQMAAEQNGMESYASNDDMPDYSNNEDMSSFV